MTRPLFRSCPTPSNQGQQHPPRSHPCNHHPLCANSGQHRQICPPVSVHTEIPMLLKAVRKGFLKGCPNLSETLLLRYLNPSLAMAKSHMKQPHHSIQSTRHHTAPVAQPLPPVSLLFDNIPVYPRPAYGAQPGLNVIADNADKLIANIFCFGAFADRNSSIVYHDLTGLFPFMSFNGSVCFFVLYHYESYAILAKPITGLDAMSIFTVYKMYFEELSAKGFKP
jgi:hypothetical protein